MTSSIAERRVRFAALHRQGCFVMPNPWDAGSARLLEHMGFAALASTSAGFAWSAARPDNGVTRDAVLAHLRSLVGAVDLPVNADFESGFATEPEQVAVNVGLAIDTGIAGLSIEDTDLAHPGRLYDRALALERIIAARQAIDRSGSGVVLVARTEGLLHDSSALAPAIDRLVAFADAGADCLFAPGIFTRDGIAAIVRAVSPRPVNVVMSRTGLSVAELADLGVRRISTGGALARVAWAAVMAAAGQIRDGSFDGLASAVPGKDLNAIFEQR